MVRILVLTFILLSNVFSQEDASEHVGVWSFYGGISSMGASVDVDDDYDESREMGFNLGLMRSVSDKWTVGVGYSQRGWSADGYDSYYDEYYKEEWELSGIELWATYNVFPLGNGTFFFGPSLLILNEADFKVEALGESYSDEFDIDDNDFSIILGVAMPLGTGSSLNLGYQRSINEIEDFILFNQLFMEISIPFSN